VKHGALTLAALAVLVLAGCGGSSSKAPVDLLFVSTADGDYAIYGADAQGAHVHRLTKERGDPSTPRGLFFQTDPAWSPDGRLIAFASRRDGNSHIFVMSADGSGTRRLTSQAFDDDHPAWSRDGTRILFGREGALFAVALTGGKATRVGHGLGRAADPAVSPNGRSVAYDYRQPGFSVREIWLMSSDGTRVHRLTTLGRVSAFPAWSPDGKRLAFESDAHDQRDQIYTIGVDGKDLRQVTRSTSDVIEPTWAPDGRITFSRDGSLWTVDAAGKETQVTSGKNNDSRPVWRPRRPG
jgi:TolB protein